MQTYKYAFADDIRRLFVYIPELQPGESTFYLWKTGFATYSQSSLNQVVALYDDGTSIGAYTIVGSGEVVSDTSTFGFPVYRKQTNCDPNGAHRNLFYSFSTSFKMYVKERRETSNTCGYDRWCVADDGGNGYGFAGFPGGNRIAYDHRTSGYTATPVEVGTNSNYTLGNWYWQISYFDPTYYINETRSESLSLIAYFSYTHNTGMDYTFTKFAILGGQPYYIDTIYVIPQHIDVLVTVTQIDTNLFKINVTNNTGRVLTPYVLDLDPEEFKITDYTLDIGITDRIPVLFSPNGSNEVYKFNTSTRQFNQIKTRDTLVVDDFLTDGNELPLTINKSELLQLANNVDILFPTGNFSMKVNPYKGMAIARVNTNGLLQNLQLSIDNLGSNTVTTLLSPDGINFYTYNFNDNQWQLVLTNPDVTNETDIDNALTNGLKPNDLANVNADMYRILLGENIDYIDVLIAIDYVTPPSESKVTSIDIIVDLGSTWDTLSPNSDYVSKQSLNSITVRFNSDGTYIVYYQD